MADDRTGTTAGPHTAPAAVPAGRSDTASTGPGPAAPGRDADSSPVRGSVWRARLLIAGVVLAAVNLRPAITSFGALLEEARTGLGMSGGVAGLLTSVPALCFAVFGIAAPRLARRWGSGVVVCAGMAAIAVGVLIRPFIGGTPGFLAASALALAGIALSNILMPVIVKRWFPDRVGTMTGLYSMGLALGTSLAAAVTVPLTGLMGGDWRAGLAVWAVPALLAMAVWLPLTGHRARRERAAASDVRATPAGTPPAAAPGGPAAKAARTGEAAKAAEAQSISITRSPTAWALACFFGLQATAAYITMGWMPQIFRDAGVPAATAGILLAVTMGLGVPLSYILPRIAAGMRTQSPLAVGLGLCGLSGYAGLYLAPASGAWVWALLLGVSNCAFPLVLTLIGMRSRTGAGVVRLSAFAQTTGYLISVPGPLLIGVLYQHSGGWGLPLALMSGLMVPQILLGVLAGRHRFIEDETGGIARR